MFLTGPIPVQFGPILQNRAINMAQLLLAEAPPTLQLSLCSRYGCPGIGLVRDYTHGVPVPSVSRSIPRFANPLRDQVSIEKKVNSLEGQTD